VAVGTVAPVIAPDDGRSNTHFIRVILSYSRRGYSEAVFTQSTDDFISGVNAGRKVQRAAGLPGRSKNAAHNGAAVSVRRIAAEPRFPPTESEARGVYADMEIWTEVRRRVLTGELSKRAACKEYGLHWRTLEKMLSHVEPPGYRRQEKREQPVLGPHLAWIHEMLDRDKTEPSKQRHTAKRIFDRLKAERGSSGGYTVVKDAVQKWKAATKEVFIPLSHPPGQAQVDFRFAGRANFLVPVPKVASLVELNEMLDERCRTDLPRQLWGKSGTKEVLLTEERAAFLPLPAQECEARRVTQADAREYATSLGIADADTIRVILFDVLSKAYERQSLIVTTNLPFEQ
jgi:transposase